MQNPKAEHTHICENLPTVIHISRFTISCYNHKLKNLLESNVLILYIQTNCNIVYTVINHPILRMTTTQKGKKIIDDNEKKYLYVGDLTSSVIFHFQKGWLMNKRPLNII